MEYIFASNRLYPVDRELDTSVHGGILVDKDVLICYEVEPVGSNNFMGASTWQFKVRGHGDVLYKTHYDWALVENTPENVVRLKALRDTRRRIEEIEREAKRQFKLVANVSTRS